MKIGFSDLEFFNEGSNFKLSKKVTGGIVLGSSIVLIGVGAGIGFSSTENTKDSDIIVSDDSIYLPIKVNLKDINDLNIILNDADCSNTFFTAVCTELEDKGIVFSVTKNCNNIDVEDSLIITLDQQYSAGPDTLILAPYENNRNDNSDALALAMKSGFYKNGFFVGEISCGKNGFRETENGEVLEQIPTETEDIAGNKQNTSFVTISFGTENAHAKLVAESIAWALGSYASFIDNNTSEDLIYRADSSDSLENIAKKFDVSVSSLNESNGRTYDDTSILVNQTFVNPSVQDIDEFDFHFPIDLVEEKAKGAK